MLCRTILKIPLPNHPARVWKWFSNNRPIRVFQHRHPCLGFDAIQSSINDHNDGYIPLNNGWWTPPESLSKTTLTRTRTDICFLLSRSVKCPKASTMFSYGTGTIKTNHHDQVIGEPPPRFPSNGRDFHLGSTVCLSLYFESTQHGSWSNFSCS